MVTFYVPTDNSPVYLLWVLSKGRVANLTREQVNALGRLTAQLKSGAGTGAA